MSAIEVKDVNYSYDGPKSENLALRNVSVKFDDNKITGLIGHTGSGKSTLVQMLNGLIKPDSGQILLDGRDIWAEPKKIRDVRFRVGLVMQYPEYQLFDATVKDDIAFGPKNMGMTPEEIERNVFEAARFTGLSGELLERSPFDLSGGQKRRVALAGVIAMKPSVLVLDEPAAGLDPGGRSEILGSIREYQKSMGAAVILVSHSMEDMAIYCDDVIVMAGGRNVMKGTPAEVFSRADELKEIGLDVPQITNVAKALRDRGFDIGTDIYTVKYALSRILEKLDKTVK